MTRLALMLAGSLAPILFGACDACGSRAHEPPAAPPRDAEHVRRVSKPTTDRVEQVPPYGIRADGIGPYKLGEKLSELLERLASGPRIALFEIPGLVHRNVIRAEDDAILIGGEQGSTASFVAVVGGADVASTESGIHVGSVRDEVVKALGPPREDLDRARDPRVIVPAAMPNLRVVLEGDHVAAIVVSAAPPVPRELPTSDCPRPPARDKAIGTCILGVGELLAIDGDEVTLHAPDTDKLLAPPMRFPGIVFAVPLRNATEGRDELVVVTRTDDSSQRTWNLSAFKYETNRMVRSIELNTPLYQVTSANARLIGADLRDLELYLELTSRPDSIEVGGLLTTPSPGKSGTKIRDLVVISPVPVARRHGKSAPVEASDAGIPTDAPAGLPDGSGASNKSKP